VRPIEAFTEICRDEGVDRIFGNPGTTELPLLEAVADTGGPPYILGLHEGAVVAMADGYARASRTCPLVNLHVAAGVANGLIGMLNAARSGTPMVITAGQQDRRHRRQDPMLSGDLVGMASTVVKEATEVEHAADLPQVLRRAFAAARRTPTGPVLVSIPMDLLDSATDVPVPERTPAPIPTAAGGIAAAAAILAAATAPALIAGDGIGREDAVGEFTALAESLGATVYPQPMYDRLNIPGTHPLCAPMLPPVAAGIAERLDGHDVVLIVGARAFRPHHYSPADPIPKTTRVIQLDADPAEPGRNFPVELALTGALRPSLRALVSALDGRVPGARERAATVAAAITADRARLHREAEAASGRTPMDPRAAVHAFATALPADAVIVEEAITAGIHLRGLHRQDRPGSYVHTVGGGLGWGIGAAIGTKMGTDRPVAALLGDGCAAFGLQGLWSAAHHRVPVLFTVMANNEYRTLKDTLDRRDGPARRTGRYPGLDLTEPAIDWQAAGRAFGVATARADDETTLADTVASLGDLDGPLLLEVPVAGHRPPDGPLERPR